MGTADPDAYESGNALPVGTRLAEFEVTGLVGEGGFGIVYRAYDHSLGRQVALKEYLPSSLATRRGDTTVSVKSAHLAETFSAGLRGFVNEARLLAQFDHPALVKVFRFWEANGTAYMVMPFYVGVTLKQALRQRSEPPDEMWLRKLLDALLDALDIIHHAQCFHRDIAPDNILLLTDDRPVLLDFGAARRVIGDRTQSLTVVLKPCYAPIEQYDAVGHLRQGAWTDLYALGAVVHYAIVGKPPPAAIGRAVNDTYLPLSKTAAGRYSARFLAAIDQALAPMPEQRQKTVAEFRQALGNAPPIARSIAGKTGPDRVEIGNGKKRWPVLATALMAVVVAAVAAYFVIVERGGSAPPAAIVAPKPTGMSERNQVRTLQPPERVPTSPRPLQDADKSLEPVRIVPAPSIPREAVAPESTAGEPAPQTSAPPRRETQMPPATRKPSVAATPSEGKRAQVSRAERSVQGSSRTPSERCVALLNRAQLGDAISAAELEYLKKECR